MDALERKKIAVIKKYASENFAEGDWYSFGEATGQLELVKNHPRLLRSMSFGDDDYDYCVAEVVTQSLEQDPTAIDDVVDIFDIDLWYEQKSPEKYRRVFARQVATPTFWRAEYLKAFISHLARSKKKIAGLKASMETWGISSFIAHEDIEPSREWQNEIEAALHSMDILIAVVEPGFRESAWTDQEVGWALGRNVDVIPLCVGEDPHGFVGKIQGIQAEGRRAGDLADAVTLAILKKPRYRRSLLAAIPRSLAVASSDVRVSKIRQLDSWNVIGDEQMKAVLESSALQPDDRRALSRIVKGVGAFESLEGTALEDEDIPF